MDALNKMITNPKITGIPWLLLRLFIGYEWIDAGLHVCPVCGHRDEESGT